MAKPKIAKYQALTALRLPDNVRAALDTAADKKDAPGGISELMRRYIIDGLKSDGLLPTNGGTNGATQAQ